jgi:serine protease
MNSGTIPTFARLGLALAACVATITAPGRTQETALGGKPRLVVQDTGLHGIDLGLRDQDPPREPGGRASRLRTLRADGTGRHNPYVRGSVIVKFRAGAGQISVVSAMTEVHGTRIERPSYADFDLMEIPADADPEEVAARLREQPDVEYAQPRYLNYAMLRPNDPLYSNQWNFTTLDMERAWDIQPGATNEITIAILDTGVAFRTVLVRYESAFPVTIEGQVYPPLGIVDVPYAVAPELGADKFVTPRDFIWEDDLPVDLDGHGTHVSGTAAQLTNNSVGVAGMAYNARIMPVKVLSDTWDDIFNSPNIGTDDVVARGVRYAADNGADVINMSLGREIGGPATVVDDAIRYAISRGAFVAIAAGNSADQGNAPNLTAMSAPSIEGMVAVAAVGRSLQRAFYSTTNSYVEIAAPGGDQRRDGTTGGVVQQMMDQALLHTYNPSPATFRPPRADMFAYYYIQGTSMATPHVAGFAALLMQQGITNPAAVEAAMKRFARDLGPAGVDTEYGHGLIQPRTTLRGLGLAR